MFDIAKQLDVISKDGFTLIGNYTIYVTKSFKLILKKFYLFSYKNALSNLGVSLYLMCDMCLRKYL